MLPSVVLERLADDALRLRLVIHALVRRRLARQSPYIVPEIRSSDGLQLCRSILERRPPWSDISIYPCEIPGMLTEAEKQYYLYISSFFSGAGAVVELGPWLGLSTHYIVKGLLENRFFAGRHMYVYDDFTWRSSWMDKWVERSDLPKIENHGSFMDLFLRLSADIREYIRVERRRISDYDGNEKVQELTWENGPVEMLIVDCGRSLSVNESWYEIFQLHFIKNRSLIIMQDWQNHKRVPEAFWENTKIFTDSKGIALDLIHEVPNAGIATFLYRGQYNDPKRVS